MGNKNSGRKKTAEPVYDEEGEADAIDAIVNIVIDDPEQAKHLSKWAKAPSRAKTVLILRACGLTTIEIAEALKCTDENIQYYLNRYDPERVFALDRDTAQKIAVSMHDSIANRALLHITPEKLNDSSAYQLSGIASYNRQSAQTILDTMQSKGVVANPGALLSAIGKAVSSLPAHTDESSEDV